MSEAQAETLREILAHAERHAIIEALSATQGNIDRAAKRLGLSRASIFRYLRKLGIIPAQVVADYRPWAALWQERQKHPQVCPSCGRLCVHKGSLVLHCNARHPQTPPAREREREAETEEADG